MKVVTGDLIAFAEEGQFDVILHGCNCVKVMGAGIARQIAKQFPEAVQADRVATPRLGEISVAHVWVEMKKLTIVNCYTQPNPGPCFVPVALEECLHNVKRFYHGSRIGYPRIGAGLGGGNWDDIAPVFDKVLEGEDHTLVEYDPQYRKKSAEDAIQKKVQHAKDAMHDLVGDYLYYDRKDDEMLERGDIRRLVHTGYLTVDELLEIFTTEFKSHFE